MPITFAEALDYLQITDSDRYDEIQELVDTSKYIIEQFLGFTLDTELATTYTIDGTDNTEFIRLPKPIDLSDITSITFNAIEQTLTDFYQYREDGFFLQLDSIYTPTTRRSITITGDWAVADSNADIYPNLINLIQYYIISWLISFDDDKLITNKIDLGSKINTLSLDLPRIVIILLDSIKGVSS